MGDTTKLPASREAACRSLRGSGNVNLGSVGFISNCPVQNGRSTALQIGALSSLGRCFLRTNLPVARVLPRRTLFCCITAARRGAAKLSIDVPAFLRSDWGVRPVLFKRLFASFQSPISPDELAGLACMPGVEARVITGAGCSPDAPDGEYSPYELHLGAFEESFFQTDVCADDKPWTLLVHEVNRWVPEVSDLLEYFSFIPNWRIDDVMVSYANTNGGVGPHVDNYDVFLLQGSGTRRWQVSSRKIPPEKEKLIPDLDVRVLDGGFTADSDYVLEPGDCLYVPPRCPHWGEALDNSCMTYSIGFRAPTVGALTFGWTEAVTESKELDSKFIADVASDLVQNLNDPGLITDASVDRAYSAVLDALRSSDSARSAFRRWFAAQVSEPKREGEMYQEGSQGNDAMPEVLERMNSFVDKWSKRGWLPSDCDYNFRQREGSVFVYYVREDGLAEVFIDGNHLGISCSPRVASFICSRRACHVSEYAGLCFELGDSCREIFDVLRKLVDGEYIYIGNKC